ncbi:hypothetical protein OHB44_13520 [Micromonospora sp. NBC_00821]|uniref:hypothetical protein n=1 Tax=Micromonospora sp. NBC_00821 TaxID=2975977 RepID=UPI002ED20D24|nr:hypothetical protein OHB44_13520 [Micromonospora sp. NBC_00821]
MTDVAAAWRAFREFLDVEIEGLVPEPDVDGFIVQWGRYSWQGGRQCVSFTRQLAVPSGSGDPQPDYWQVDLTLVFDDAAGLAVLESGHQSDTGFYFRPVGPQRDDAVVEAGRHLQLDAALTVRPAHSKLSFDRVC